jgi:predicted dehydrogenase
MRRGEGPKPIYVAVLGCGWAGTRHARAFARLGAEVRWAVDAELSRAEALQRELKTCLTATDYHQALGDPDVDVVAICLPHHLHAPVAIAAAQAWKHILCEKPLATSLDEADRMIAAADQSGAILMVAENVRFDPLYRKVRDLVQGGVIGRPAVIQVTRETYLTRSFAEERRWYLDQQAAGGGIMMAGGIHDFEALRMLVGEVESVQSLRARQRFAEMQGDDTSVAMVRFAGGAVGTLVESSVMKSLPTAAGAEVHTLRIDGDDGSLSVQDGTTIRFFTEGLAPLPDGILVQHDLHVPAADTFSLEVAHLLECIRTGTEPITSGRSQRRPLELVLAAYRSMQTGQAVHVPPEPPAG